MVAIQKGIGNNKSFWHKNKSYTNNNKNSISGNRKTVQKGLFTFYVTFEEHPCPYCKKPVSGSIYSDNSTNPAHEQFSVRLTKNK